MSFYTSLSGLKGAQTDLSVISNNVANVSSLGFKKSRAIFGDLFSAAPSQSTKMVAGQGVRLNGVQQQFTQGTLESTEKVLDLALSGQGMFTVKGGAPNREVSFTRNGAFAVQADRTVTDTTGATLQLLPVDADGNVTSRTAADMVDFVMPAASANDPNNILSNVAIDERGLVIATFSDGSTEKMGRIALANFTSFEGLRPRGEAHWQATGFSGAPEFGGGGEGTLGAVRSGALERANVDITEELVALIAAQRNFQANAKAIETANTMTSTIVNIRG